MRPGVEVRVARCLAGLVVAAALWGPTQAQAQGGSLDVPAQLEGWIPWVMYDHPDRVCAQLRPDSHQCAWPGELALTVEDKGGSFALVVWLDRKTQVRLPGNGDLWPQDVKANDAAVVVGKNAQGLPFATLPAGQHKITGAFSWRGPPEVIAVAPETGRVDLVRAGKSVSHPRLDLEGRLWLQGGADGARATEADSLRVSVFRRIFDGVPMRIINRFELNVSGRAREVSLGSVLLPETRAGAVRGGLPLQAAPDGSVRVYVKPGSHWVEIDTLVTAPRASLSAPKRDGGDFDPQEVWVWEPDSKQRAVELSGLDSVDPERTALPSDWRGGSTFLVAPGDTLKLAETRRGEVSPAPNTLQLHRSMWLDLDGQGYTVSDRLSGQMHQGWRLEHTGSGALGRVTQPDEGTDLLITTDAVSKLSGVELRASTIALQAELRLEEADRTLDVVGWDHDVQALSAELHLPPGWDLIGGGGVDKIEGTWLESWSLFDFFFLLMIALSLGKLCGWRWAPVAALALCLTQGHADAPRWIWIHLLATLALIRVLPEGWFRRAALVYRVTALLVLGLLLAPYARDQVRFALHPQVDRGAIAATTGWGDSGENMDFALERGEAQKAAPGFEPGMDAQDIPAQPLEEDQSKSDLTRSIDGYAAQEGKKMGGEDWAQRSSRLQQIDPNAVVQTGPGLPTWSWRQWNLQWTGPVSKDHQINLWMLSPTWNRALTLLRVALLILLALLLVARRDMVWLKPGGPKGGGEGGGEAPGGPAAAAVVAVIGIVCLAAPGWAQEPSGPQLSVLKERVLAQVRCDGPCVVASSADIAVDEQALSMKAEVHALKDSAWFLPGPADLLHITSVKVDGVETRQLRREPGGLTAVRLAEGLHTVEVEGVLVARDVVTLNLDAATRPQRVRFVSAQWDVDGISDAGIPDNSLQMTRKQAEAGSDAGAAEMRAELPPWYRVERHLALGLPWQLVTEVHRDNTERPQLVKIPLVEGEKVITEGVRVEKGQALVNFPRDQASVSYASELPITPTLRLSAATEQPWTESWTVACSRIWRCAFSSLPPVHSVDGAATYAPLWRPWPGESLDIEIGRPEGTPGQAMTVDRALYEVTPGKRLLEARLTMRIRASQGGWQEVKLPEGAQIQSIDIGGQSHNIALEGGVAKLPIKPGAQELVMVWQQPWDRALYEQMPPIQIGARAVNATLRLNLGADRWLLWVTGPSWGPAILFWSHLVILLILAIVLGRIKLMPLKTWEWLLLAIGMAQLPVVALLPVVAWFAALVWRQRSPRPAWWQFNIVQLGLVGATFIALGTLYGAIHTNLLFDVDMQVRGAGSSEHVLQWYVDRVDSALPPAGIVSLPLIVWRITMLLWALWLVTWLLKWVPWGWRAFSHGGLWRPLPRSAPAGAGSAKEDGAGGAEGGVEGGAEGGAEDGGA